MPRPRAILVTMRFAGFLALLALCAAAAARAAVSPDGRLSWEPGDDHVDMRRPSGFRSRGREVPLPALEKGARRSVVFAPSGDSFAVLDQATAAVGLHQDSPRGSRAAQAFVAGATLRMVAVNGRVLWTKKMPETHAVGGEGAAQPLALGGDGSAALLLQDVDPYTKARPLVIVFDAKGRERLRLDYTAWSRVDEMLLSGDGAWLALRGIGRVPDQEAWGAALGHYRLSDGDRLVVSAAAASGGSSLLAFSDDGTVCCLREGKSLVAVGHDGARQTLTREEAARRFGLKP